MMRLAILFGEIVGFGVYGFKFTFIYVDYFFAVDVWFYAEFYKVFKGVFSAFRLSWRNLAIVLCLALIFLLAT
jgi:hypothetical protein